MSGGAMEKSIKKFCELNQARFTGYSEGMYNFLDSNGTVYYLTQSDLRSFMKKQNNNT